MDTSETKVLRTTVVSACAAFLCGFLAFQVGALWWVGSLLGAVVGWVGYDPIGFARGLKRAFVATWQKMANRKKREQLPRHIVRCNVWTSIAFLVVGASAILWMNMSIIPLATKMAHPDMILALQISIVEILFMLFFFILILATQGGTWRTVVSPEQSDEIILSSKRLMLRWNPIVAPFTMLYYILKWLPTGARFVADTAIATYAFTISDGRIACAVGSSMGVAIGYFAGSLTLCGVAGGLVGCTLALSKKFREARL